MFNIINEKISNYAQVQSELECHPNKATSKAVADLLEFVKEELRSLRRLQAKLEEGNAQ